MSEVAQELWLVRHGETEWSRDHRHTSTTELPLTDVGVGIATELAGRLDPADFDLVLSSPRQRARETARLAGFPEPEVDADLAEWDYGDYEGITTVEIRETVPGWTVWSHPTPGGETADEIGARLDRVVERVSDQPGRTLVFGHGHALRVLTARALRRALERAGVCSPRAGSACRSPTAGSSAWTPPRSRCSASSGTAE